MSVIMKLFVFQIVFICFAAINIQAAITNQHSVLTILKSKATTDQETFTTFLVELNERESGLELSLQFELKDEKIKTIPDPQMEPGGDFSLYLDGINVHRQFYSGTSVTTSHILPLSDIPDGKHTIHCELRTPMGKLLDQNITFILNTSPTIEVEMPKDGSGVFDPMVGIGFIDEKSEVAGHLEVHVDERPLAIVPITQADNNKKFLLSELLKKKLPITSLPQGNHLLRLLAQGINGSKTIQYIPFTVDTTPELEIIRDEDGQLREIKAFFAQPSEGFSGAVNIYYRQGVIFAKRSLEKQLFVTRADIISALKEHNHLVPDEPTSFVISVNSANGVEEWQEVTF